MAITDATKISKVYVILGMPQKDTAFGLLGIATLQGPAGEQFTVKEARAQIDAALAAATASEEALIDLVLTEFDKIFLKHSEIYADGTTQGLLFSASDGMEILRVRTSTILGIFVPVGGFERAFKAIYQRSPGPVR